jgi:hypothetical protein
MAAYRCPMEKGANVSLLITFETSDTRRNGYDKEDLTLRLP